MGIGKYNDNYHKENTLTAFEQSQKYLKARQARRQAQQAKTEKNAKSKNIVKF